MAKEQQIEALIAPGVAALGYELWGVEYQTHGRQALLRVYIDSPEGISVEDCATVSRQISALLDVEDPISGEYLLEVSSPGMDRPLYTLDHFARFAGELIKLRLRAPVEGRRNFSGLLKGVEEDDVVVEVDAHEYLLPFDLIERANVVPRFE